jgi:sec-independent protein translocase protein TatA
MAGLGTQEMLLLLVLGVLFFGKRLPEVGRSVGKTIMEFRNNLNSVKDEFSSTFRDIDFKPAVPPPRRLKRIEPTAPKFTEPAEPV